MSNWNMVEIAWTAIAAPCFLLALYGLHEAGLDWRAERAGRRDPARMWAARWAIAGAMLLVLMFGGFTIVGWIAGQQPDRPIETAQRAVPASVLSGAILITIEVWAAAYLVIGLVARARIVRTRRHRVIRRGSCERKH